LAQLEGTAVQLRIEIVDTGIGLRGADPAVLFKEFSSQSAAFSRASGTGLGLSIVKRITNAFGGTCGLVEEDRDIPSIFLGSRIAIGEDRTRHLRLATHHIPPTNEDGNGASTGTTGRAPAAIPTLHPSSPLRRECALLDPGPYVLLQNGRLALLGEVDRDSAATSLPAGMTRRPCTVFFVEIPVVLPPNQASPTPLQLPTAGGEALTAAPPRSPPPPPTEKAEATGTTTTTTTHVPSSLAGVHVLLMEDDMVSRTLTKRMLIRLGATVALASNAHEAEEYLLTNAPDDVRSAANLTSPQAQAWFSNQPWQGVNLCCFDIHVGVGRTGDLLLSDLQQRGCRIPAIALTGTTAPQNMAKLRKCGFVDVLSKPFDSAQLLDAAAKALGR
jgi:CheY-like chemotaxis protein